MERERRLIRLVNRGNPGAWFYPLIYAKRGSRAPPAVEVIWIKRNSWLKALEDTRENLDTCRTDARYANQLAFSEKVSNKLWSNDDSVKRVNFQSCLRYDWDDYEEWTEVSWNLNVLPQVNAFYIKLTNFNTSRNTRHFTAWQPQINESTSEK